MATAVVRLKNDPDLHAQMAQDAYEYVHAHFERQDLARRYAEVLKRVALNADV